MDEKINYKKLSEGVIIYILKTGDRHIEEIRDIILNNFFSISSSAIYPIFSNMVKKNLIKEYRFSNPDGSRRKFYTLTDKGLKEFENNYIFYFKDAPVIPVKEEIIEEPVKKEKTDNKPIVNEQPKESIETVSVVEKEHQPTPYDDIISDIDFGKISDILDSEKQKEQTIQPPKEEEKQSIWQQSVQEPEKTEEVVEDYDSISDKSNDYKNILSSFFPKARSNIEITQETEKIDETPVLPEVKNETKIVTDANFSDMYDYAENHGLVVKTSHDTNRYQGTNILVNKLRLHTSLITMLSILVLYLFTTLIFYKSVGFNGKAFLIVLIISVIPVLVSLFLIIFNSNKTKKELKKFKEVIEIALIIAISALIVTISVAAFKEINFKSFSDIYYSLIVPFIVEIHIPLFEIIKYSIYKKNAYQC